MKPVGWYVHHHGSGHLMRFLAVRPHLDAEVHVFSSLDAPDSLPARTAWTVLPPDDVSSDGTDPRDADPTAHGALHWAPLGHDGHRDRMGTVARACTSGTVGAFVVDVSVEVSALVRLLGTPVVVFSQPGERTDPPHTWLYRAADRIIAPWPRELLASSALERVADRVRWVGGITRFDGRPPTGMPRSGSVLSLGTLPAEPGPLSGMTRLGATPSTWTPDPWDALCRHEVVVSAAGQNSIADLAAAGARAVVIPQERPFDEQRAMGRALERAGLALVVDRWPSPDQWPATLAEARAARPEWHRWQTRGAAARAAAAIAEVAR